MRTSTILILDVFSVLDASRSGLIDAFTAEGCHVIIANFTYSHLTRSDIASARLDEYLYDTGRDIDAVISINAAGVCQPIHETCRRRGIPHLAWFIDTPHFYPDLTIPDDTLLAVACTNFTEHPATARARWLPFAGKPGIPHPKEDKKATIGFLGAIHQIGLHSVAALHGLIGSRSGHVPAGLRLRQIIRAPEFMTSETWAFPDGLEVNRQALFNSQSSMHRLEILSYFTGSDLEIQGPDDWRNALWVYAPHLLPHFTTNIVSGSQQMQEYMKQYEICLNIFHLQNMNGGPNFRNFDAAAHHTPCLSQYNLQCHSLFPHGEAALYFNNAAEAANLHTELSRNARLRQKIARNAHAIMLDGHTFGHRARQFMEQLSINSTSNTKRGTSTHLFWNDEWICSENLSSFAANDHDFALSSNIRSSLRQKISRLFNS